MNIVVDASVLIAVIVGEPHRERLIQLTEGADLVAPYSVHWEIGNALAAMVRRNRIALEEALMAIRIYEQIPIRYVGVEIEEALRIAGELRIYAYDAYLIRCAEKYRLPLLTLDRGLMVAAQQRGIEVLNV